MEEMEEDEKKIEELLKAKEKDLLDHSKTLASKNLCSFLWLSEIKLLKSISNMNLGKEDGLMAEEKVGFKGIGRWFIFPEEAIYLNFLKKISIYVLNDKKIDETEILIDKLEPKETQIDLIQNNLMLYSVFYKIDMLKIYNSLAVSIMYNFFRRKGNFLKRVNLNMIQKELEVLNKKTIKKQKVSKLFAMEENLDILNKIQAKFNVPIFLLFETSESLQKKQINSVLVLRKMNEEVNIDISMLEEMVQKISLNIKLVLVENQDVVTVDILKDLDILN